MRYLKNLNNEKFPVEILEIRTALMAKEKASISKSKSRIKARETKRLADLDLFNTDKDNEGKVPPDRLTTPILEQIPTDFSDEMMEKYRRPLRTKLAKEFILAQQFTGLEALIVTLKEDTSLKVTFYKNVFLRNSKGTGLPEFEKQTVSVSLDVRAGESLYLGYPKIEFPTILGDTIEHSGIQNVVYCDSDASIIDMLKANINNMFRINCSKVSKVIPFCPGSSAITQVSVVDTISMPIGYKGIDYVQIDITNPQIDNFVMSSMRFDKSRGKFLVSKQLEDLTYYL